VSGQPSGRGERAPTTTLDSKATLPTLGDVAALPDTHLRKSPVVAGLVFGTPMDVAPADINGAAVDRGRCRGPE